MEEQVQSVSSVAVAMAKLSAQAAAAANAQRLRIAQGNVAAGTAQLQREESAQRRAIARSLNEHLGSAAASSAFRGASGRSAEQGAFASTVEAVEQAAIVSANRAANEMALIASNQVMMEDPLLASIQGAMTGLELGSAIASSLVGMTDTVTRQSSERLGTTSAGGGPTIPTFSNTVETIAQTPGLNLAEVFQFSNGNFSLNFGLGAR